MLLSFIVYILFALLLFLLGWHLNSRETLRLQANQAECPFYSWEIVLSIAIITIVMGLRFKTGTDYIMYWTEYLHISKGHEFSRAGGFEKGYELITRLFAWLQLHYTIYFAFWALLQAFLLFYGLRHHKFLLPWMGLLLVLGPYSINWFSFIRQWVVTCAFLPMLYLIYHKKYFPYVVITLALSTIHLSALLLLVLYFLPYKKIANQKKHVYWIVFAIVVILGIRPVWVVLFKPFVPLLPLLGYDRYVDMFNELIQGNYRLLAFGPLHIIVLYSQIVVLFYYNRIKSYKHNDKLLPLFFSFAFLAICLDNLLVNTVHFFLRPLELLYIFVLIMLAYVYDYLYNSKRYLELAITILPIVLYVPINVLKANLISSSPLSEFVSYHFFFLYSL